MHINAVSLKGREKQQSMKIVRRRNTPPTTRVFGIEVKGNFYDRIFDSNSDWYEYFQWLFFSICFILISLMYLILIFSSNKFFNPLKIKVK